MLTYLSMKKLSHRGLKRPPRAWTGVVQLAGALPHGWNGRRFDSCSAHIPRLGLWSLVLACMRGNPLTFLSHMGFSLPPSLSSSIPLSLKSVCPWVRIPKKKKSDLPDESEIWTQVLLMLSPCTYLPHHIDNIYKLTKLTKLVSVIFFSCRNQLIICTSRFFFKD